MDEPGISVSEVLSLPAFRNVRLAAGQNGLGRIVMNVNVMEVPDIVPWVKSGDMLITTGYAIKDNPQAQHQLIPELHDRGAAALAIKPKRYIECLPASMLEAAERLSFPVLELPLEANFSDLISAVLGQIVNRQATVLEQSLTIHQKLTDLILKGGELEQIAVALADMLQGFVCLVDTLNFRYVVHPREGPAAPEQATSPIQQQAASLIPQQATPLIPHAPALVQQAASLLQQQARRMLPPANPSDPAPTAPGARRETVKLGGQDCELLTLPVIVERKHYGHVLALVPGRTFSSWDLMAMERVCSIMAVDILRRHGIAQVEYRYRAEFLNQLLSDNNLRTESVCERARIFGWDLTRTYVAILIGVWPRAGRGTGEPGRGASEPGRGASEPSDKLDRVAQDQATTMVENYCHRNGLTYLVASHENRILLFVHLEEDPDRRRLMRVTQGIREALGRWNVCFGIGGPYPGPDGLRRSFQEARIALEVGRDIHGPTCEAHYDDLGIYSLILRRPSLPEQRAFVEQLLGPVLLYDRTKKTESLFRTLQVYLDTGGNVKKTAALLYTHYNTVLYRLSKIKELTRLDPKDPEHRVTLQVAAKLFRIFEGAHLPTDSAG